MITEKKTDSTTEPLHTTTTNITTSEITSQPITKQPYSKEDFTTSFEITTTKSSTSATALFEVISRSDSTTSTDLKIATNFQYDWGGWHQETGDNFNWTRKNGSTPSTGTGPTNGHSGYSQDYYAYIETSNPVSSEMSARLRSPLLPLAQRYSLEFYYHMYGAKMGTLRVYRKSIYGYSPRHTSLWSRSGNQGNSWHYAKVYFQRDGNGDNYIVFEASDGISYTGDIAIDDILISVEGSTPWPPTSMEVTGRSDLTASMDSNIVTNFQYGWGGWYQDSYDDFDWTRIYGSTPSTGTGPTSGHSGYSQDYYAYIETTSLFAGASAILRSPLLPFAQNYSLEFYYHMYGSGIGRLQVFRKSTNGYSYLWSRSGNQGNSWHYAKIQFQRYGNSDNYIAFEGIDGTSFTGDIAIDDILISVVGSTGATTSIEVTSHSDSTASTDSNIVTNFQYGWGGWYQESSDDFDWTRKYGSTSSIGTGPTSGHSGYSRDYYAYIETTSIFAGASAILRSPLLPLAQNYSLEFYYHMYGAKMGTLNVFRKSTNGYSYLWSRSGNQGNSWHYAKIQFQRYGNSDNYIAFEGIDGTSFTGDIAIDDILISVEVTNFQNDWGGWHQEFGDDFDWTRIYGFTKSTGTGPTNGHSGYSLDYYIYIETSDPISTGMSARLQSPLLPLAKSYSLEFYYHMYGSKMGTLNVYRKSTNGYDIIWSRSGNQWNSWHYAKVQFQSYGYSGTYIVFEGIDGTSFTSDIAIDDISIFVEDSLYTILPDLTTSSESTTSADSNIDVVCGDNSMTIYVRNSIVSNSTTPHLLDQSCVPYGYVTRNGIIWMYFMTQYDQCGTYLTSSIEDYTYHNELTFQHVDEKYHTYHENSNKIAVRCRFENTAELSLSFITHEVVKVSSKESYGNLTFQLQLYTDEHFTQPIPTWRYPVTLDIGTRVYVGAKVKAFSTEMTLFIDSFIASPTQEADAAPNFKLIDQRCSLDDPSLIFHSLGVVGKSGKNVLFSFNTFGFVGYSRVFLHCNMSVCNSTDWRCSSDCSQRIKRSADNTDVKRETYPVMLGPIILKHNDDVSFDQLDKSTRKTSTGGNVMMLVGVMTFLVGCVSLARSIKNHKSSLGYKPLIGGEQEI
ncbi:MAM and LDL-receptor class A domain-containing protein 1-like isoform X2 [Anneissia japonica]|nr:MAM and LDL-receptor class A domain-containing protein 1-like isoform X2 [Anneissia japonica]XP_033122956.1 MAM and LDL-receptor class A domain-containing protein 1-like isoform X2 [Anneissia japonica]